MTTNNPLLLNACLQGIAAAALAGSGPAGTGSAVTAANAASAAQALTVATAVDAAILVDATITTAGSPNATTAPTTGTIANAQASKSGLMSQIAFGAFEGQANGNVIPAGAEAALVAGIVAKYNATISSLVTG